MDADLEDIYSAQQLLKQRKLCSKAPGNFSKFRAANKWKTVPKSGPLFDEYCDTLNAILDNKLQAIKKQRLKQQKDIGEAIYCPFQRSIRVTNPKSKPSFMGFVQDGFTYLHPEEALFLMESDAVEVKCNDLPLSIQEAYSMFFQDSKKIYDYKVYVYLSRFGFKLKPHLEKSAGNANEYISNSFCKKRDIESCDDLPSKKMKCDENRYKVSVDSKPEDNCQPMVLEKQLFLEDFEDPFALMFRKKETEECKSWKEFKELSSSAKDYGYFNKGIVFNKVNEAELLNTFPHFSSVHNDIDSLMDCNQILTADEIYKRLNFFGPQIFENDFETSNLVISYDCFAPSNKKTSDTPDFYVVVVKANSDPPSTTDITALVTKSSPVEILFAVVHETEFNFYKIKPFKCWEEFPMQWKNTKIAS